MSILFDALLGRVRKKDIETSNDGIAISDVSGLSTALSGKIDSTEKGAANGVPQLDANGKIPSDEIPIAGNSASKIGGMWTGSAYGLTVTNSRLQVAKAETSAIDGGSNNYQPIVPSNLKYAVRSVSPGITAIPAATTAYTLLDASSTENSHSFTYTHAPTSAPTYTLPAVTDATFEHTIVLYVDFTTVQTCTFKNASNSTIAPLDTISISAKDVVEYRCSYVGALGSWVIRCTKLGTKQS